MGVRKKAASDLQPIGDLFSDSWALYKKTVLSYLKVLGVGLLLIFTGTLILVLLLLPLFITSGGSVDHLLAHATWFQYFLIFLVFFSFVLYLLILIAYLLMMPIMYLLILTNTKKESIKSLINRSKPYIIPYFMTNLLLSFFVVGGFAVFVIPGLILSLFFIFTLTIIVLENKTGRAALLRSYQLVKAYFWQILLRVIIIEAGVIIVSNILNNIAKEVSSVAIISRLFSLFVEWFVVIYLFLLYKQIREKVPADKTVSMNWIWVVSIIGWILIICLLGAFLSGSLQLPSSRAFAA